MSLLDTEDEIWNDAYKRAFIERARAVVESRSCNFTMAQYLDRQFKLAIKNYFIGEIVWEPDFSGTTMHHYVLYEDKVTGPEWLKID